MNHPLTTSKLIFLLALLTAAFSSCKTTATSEPTTTVPNSTYSLVKTRIFDVSCTQCHNATDAALNGHLNLQGDTAYAMLVGAMPFNSVAAADTLLRISPSHPERSFLCMKLSGNLEPGMGNQMPNLLHPITAGKVNFIRQWIAAGAPKTGNVADTNLLIDTSSDLQAPLIPLAVPAAGTGFQIHMPAFDIPAGSEREIFIYKNNPNTDTQYVKQMDIRMREGSHHFILWNVDGATEGLTDGFTRDRNDMEMQRNRDFANGSQTNELHYIFPDSVALMLPPNKGFDLNSHYVNPTTQTMHGEAYMNLLTVPKSAVKHLAIPFLSADTKFNIPAHATYTRKNNWPAFTKTTHLIMLTSHSHKHMTSFKIFKNSATGEQIYSTTDWHEPAIDIIDMVFQKGEKLYSETTWQNDGATSLKFGYTTEDEMNIILGYYWEE